MLINTRLGIIMFLLIFTIGCKDDLVEEDVSVSIEAEFKVLPWETLSANSRDFYLNVETIKSQSCENSVIEVAPSTIGNNISFTIHDIPEPDCPAPVFTASANIEIGSLSAQTYDLIISLKNVVQNQGTMIVNDDYYEIKMKDLNGIVVPHKRLYKVPKSTIWGYVGYENSASDSIANNFLNEVQSVSEEKEYEDGFYGYFETTNNQITILNKNLSQNVNSTFGFSYQNNTNELIDILSNYRSSNPNMEFVIFTSEGEEL